MNLWFFAMIIIVRQCLLLLCMTLVWIWCSLNTLHSTKFNLKNTWMAQIDKLYLNLITYISLKQAKRIFSIYYLRFERNAAFLRICLQLLVFRVHLPLMRLRNVLAASKCWHIYDALNTNSKFGIRSNRNGNIFSIQILKLSKKNLYFIYLLWVVEILIYSE